MSLTLAAATQAVLAGARKVQFDGVGGATPYSYSVLPGGAGGTINPSTGLYTSPSNVNEDPKKVFDTVQVVDDDAAEATLPILVGNPTMLLCDIIQKEMELDDGQVYQWDQKINIPTDQKLYVAVGVLNARPFGNSIKLDANGEAIQYVQMLVGCSIDILSRGPAARDRKEEVILALQSFYAQTQQELNGFYIAKISTGFVNLSQIEGAAIPYRFNISVNLQYNVSKTKPAEYFDTFDEVSVGTQP